MRILAVITNVKPEDCGACVIYLKTPRLTACGATKRLTCGGMGVPEWCPLLTADQYMDQEGLCVDEELAMCKRLNAERGKG